MTNRFPANNTNEIILPLPHRRGVRVTFPRDLTIEEWTDVTDVVLQKIQGEKECPNEEST